jgi:hypothetical protein
MFELKETIMEYGKIFPFIDSLRDPKLNETLMGITRNVIVESAVSEGLIRDDDLAMIPEAMPILSSLAGASRDDIYDRAPETGIQFPTIQKIFCYNFAKGVESAFLWNLSSDGKIEFPYNPSDAFNGLLGVAVSKDFQGYINYGIPVMENVFCDFQNRVVANPQFRFANSGRWLADCLAFGLFWSANVGIDYGMDKLGFK